MAALSCASIGTWSWATATVVVMSSPASHRSADAGIVGFDRLIRQTVPRCGVMHRDRGQFWWIFFGPFFRSAIEVILTTRRPADSATSFALDALNPVGVGRRTRQYNPQSDGAKTLAQWLTAVTTTKGESDAMPVDAAVAMIHATPAEKRSQFGMEIWRLRRAHGTDRRAEAPF